MRLGRQIRLKRRTPGHRSSVCRWWVVSSSPQDQARAGRRFSIPLAPQIDSRVGDFSSVRLCQELFCTGVLPYICPICGKQFRTNKLSAHMSTHGVARLACPRAGCGRRFSSRRALQRHALSHAPAAVPPQPPPPPHACTLCPARYHHKQSLNKHVKKQHTQVSLALISKQSMLLYKSNSCLSKITIS